MPAPSITQTPVSAESSGANVISCTLTGVAAGATLVVCFSEMTSNRKCEVHDATNGAGKDSANNAWTLANEVRETVNEYWTQMWYAENVAGGNTTVRLKQVSDLNFIGQMALIELSASEYETSGTNNNGSATDHHAAASGAIATAANVAVIVSGVSALGRTITQKAGWDRIDPGGTYDERAIFAYETSDTALTDERGTWTTALSDYSAGVIASFIAGGAPPPAAWTPRVTMVL